MTTSKANQRQKGNKGVDRKKELEREMEALRKEQHDLEQKEFLEKAIPAAQKAVGDCFVYRNNNYGGGRPKFDTFHRVIAFTPRTRYNYGVTIIYERVQIDDEGCASIEMGSNTIMPDNRGSRNHVGLLALTVPCSREEYAAMRERVLAAFDDPTEAIAALAQR